jgi:hypothetical protein
MFIFGSKSSCNRAEKHLLLALATAHHLSVVCPTCSYLSSPDRI